MDNPDGISDIDYWPNMPRNGCDSDARYVYGGNPDVFIDPDYMGTGTNSATFTPDYPISAEDPLTLDFTQVTASLDNVGYDPTSSGGVGTGTPKVKSDSVVQYTEAGEGYWTADASHPDSAECVNLPDPEKADGRSRGWIYSPYYEKSHPNWDPSSRSYLEAPIFAEVGTGVYRIHDRRFSGVLNTPENPISDGGGQMTLESPHLLYRVKRVLI